MYGEAKFTRVGYNEASTTGRGWRSDITRRRKWIGYLRPVLGNIRLI
jgi:hypothetical protein